MITFTPLSEPYDGSSQDNAHEKARALAYLAEVDDVRILVDCGAPEEFRFSDVGGGLDDVLRGLAPSIDLVLLCHSSMSHLGLYAYAKARFGLSAPCYTTLPVATMGRLTILESVQSLRAENDFERLEKQSDADEKVKKEENSIVSAQIRPDAHWCVATMSEINEAFEQMNTLRYLQPTQLEGKCAGLTLMAYSAGHTLGGAVWKLRSPSSGTLLIALDWNHIRERHIDGTALIASSSAISALGSRGDSTSAIADAIRRPDVFITSMTRSLYKNARRKDKDAALLDVIHNTIRGGNSVLIPVDAASRLLELLVLLDQHWAYAYPHVRFPLCLVSHTGREMIERARTLMEWMTKEWVRKGADEAAANADANANLDGEESGEGVRKKQKTGRFDKAQAPSSPLDFKFLRIFSSLNALDEALSPNEAKVVLAWPPSLTHGPARKLVARMANNERDVILLTGRGEPDTLARMLYDEWEQQQSQSAHWGRGEVGKSVQGKKDIQLEIHSKVPLEGEELEAFNEARRIAREKATQQRALLARSTRRAEADDDDALSGSDSSDSDTDDDGAGILDETQAHDGENGRTVASRKRSQVGQDLQDIDGFPSQQEVSFDIYLKGNASRTSTVFGSSVERSGGRYKTGVRFRTFPVVERKKRIDGYGEMLDLSKWMHRRRQLEALGGEQAESQTLEDQKANAAQQQAQKDKEEEERRKEQEPPSKFIVEIVNVSIQCKLFFVELDGLGDTRALRTIVPQLEPRRAILVGSKDDEHRSELKQYFSRQHGMTKDLFMPVVGERIEIGESTANFTVNLGEDLMASLRFSSFQDYQVALVKANVTFRTESSIPILEPFSQPATVKEVGEEEDTKSTVKEEPTEESETIDLASGESNGMATQPTTMFIGDLKLSLLKQTLAHAQKPAIPSEFVGQGTLVCGSAAFRTNSGSGQSQDEVVTVRKEGQGEIVIEGNASQTFYRVRDAVYRLHAQVTGQ